MSNSHRTSRKAISYVLAGILLISMLFSLGGDLHPVQASGFPPIAVLDTYIVTLGETLIVDDESGLLSNDFDFEGDPLTAIKVNDPALGALIFSSDGSFNYTPGTGFTTEDEFTYYVNDGDSDSNTVTVYLRTSVNNEPPPIGVGTGTCMTADCGGSYNCTSDRTQISDIYIQHVDDICMPPTCNPATGICTPDTGQYDIMVIFNPNATSLYDIGFWALTDTVPEIPVSAKPVDGVNNAITGGTCYKSYMYPATQIDLYNFTSGLGPFRELDTIADYCGDVSSTDNMIGNEGYTYRLFEDVPIVCTDELMEGLLPTVVTWQQKEEKDPCIETGTCPLNAAHCYAQLVPFDATNKPVDLSLTKTTEAENVDIGEQFTYTIRISNNLYDGMCYRSSGYILEDLLPDYLYPIDIIGITYDTSTGEAVQTGTLDTDDWSCVDEYTNDVDCDYGSIVHVEITGQVDLPAVDDPQPLYSESVLNSYCEDQYHEFTLTVKLGNFDPNGVIPYVVNNACVNGLQYDPIGVDYEYYDPVLEEIVARAYSPNNCDDEPLPLAVEMESFTATNGKLTIQLDWKTAFETHNLGFNLYRSTSETGERIKLNSEIITPYDGYLGSPIGATYHWTDTKLGSTGLRPNTTYYYWLEDVPSNDDAPEEFGPVTGMLIIGKK